MWVRENRRKIDGDDDTKVFSLARQLGIPPTPLAIGWAEDRLLVTHESKQMDQARLEQPYGARREEEKHAANTY